MIAKITSMILFLKVSIVAIRLNRISDFSVSLTGKSEGYKKFMASSDTFLAKQLEKDLHAAA